MKLLFTKLRCVVCNVVAHSALPTYNAALNRPAYQSSVWSNDRGRYIASLANDGDHETKFDKGRKPRCSHTNHESNPWWAVDLGNLTTIYRVDLTNRGDRAGIWLFFCSFSVFSYSFVLFIMHIGRVEVSDSIPSCFRVCHYCSDEIYAGVCRNAKRDGQRHGVKQSAKHSLGTKERVGVYPRVHIKICKVDEQLNSKTVCQYMFKTKCYR